MADDASKIVFEVTHTFWWPVTVALPADGGGTVEASFEARFTLAPDDVILGRGIEEGTDPLEHERQVLRDHLAGWRGLTGPGGGALPFDDHYRDLVLSYGAWRRGLSRAFWEAHTGGAGGGAGGETARAKN